MSLVVLEPYPLIIKVLQAQYLDFSKIQIFQKSSIFGQAGDFGNLYLKNAWTSLGNFLICCLYSFRLPEKQSGRWGLLGPFTLSQFFCRWLRLKLKILDDVIHQGGKIPKKCFNLPVLFLLASLNTYLSVETLLEVTMAKG